MNFIYSESITIKLECIDGLSALAEFASGNVIREMVDHQVIGEMIAAKSTLEDNSIKLSIIRILGNLTGQSDEYIINVDINNNINRG